MNTIKNVTVLVDFKDGDLSGAFEELGYPAKWKRGERRDLPKEIVDRVAKSGGVITIADDNARESQIVVGAETAPIDPEAHWQKQFSKAKRLRVLFPKGFHSGDLAAECAAVGHPPTFGAGEIAELPFTLVEKIRASGGFFETGAEALAQFASRQGKYILKVKQWQDEQERAKADKEKRAELGKHNQSILAEIEQLDTEYITATGKTKEALWKRRMELRKSLK